MRNRIATVSITLALGTALVACGSDSKTVKTPDGKVTVNGDGKNGSVTVEGENGASATFGSQKVPEDFPSAVPLPDGLKLQSAITGTESGSEFFQLLYALGKTSPQDAISDYQDQLEADDFEVGESGSIGSGGASLAGFKATKGDWTVVASSVGGSSSNAILSLAVKNG